MTKTFDTNNKPPSSTKELWHDTIEEANPFTTYSWDERERIVDTPSAESKSIQIKKVDCDNQSPSKLIKVEEAKGNQPPTTGRKESRLSSVMATCNPVEAWRDRDMSSTARRRRKIFCWTFALSCIIVAIGLLASSLKKVPSTEMGVQYNIHKKQLDDATKSGGLFVGPPGYKFIKFPSTFITVDMNDRTCVSNDGLLVKFSVTFQVRIIVYIGLPRTFIYILFICLTEPFPFFFSIK